MSDVSLVSLTQHKQTKSLVVKIISIVDRSPPEAGGGGSLQTGPGL